MKNLEQRGFTVCWTGRISLVVRRCNTFSTQGNTSLGKLIRQAKKEHPNCSVWYEATNLEHIGDAHSNKYVGDVSIGYKEP